MGKDCIILHISKRDKKGGITCLHSFLDKNVWFNGDIIITYLSNELEEEDKTFINNFYDRVYYVEFECSKKEITTKEVFNNFIEVDYDECRTILLFESNLFFNGCVEDQVKEGERVVNLSEYSNNSNLISEENINECTIIQYNNIAKPWNGVYNYADYKWEEYYDNMVNNGAFYTFDLYGHIYRFKKDFRDRDKYVVCACAKNENDYIVEWVEHYFKLGFDKIFICDNNNPGDDSIYEVLENYIKNGSVEIFDCRALDCFQVQFYTMFCETGNYKWCGYFDCDEFLEIPAHFDIKSYLQKKEGEICISFHWMIFGSNGEMIKSDGGVKERFKYPVSPLSIFTENCFVKSLIKGGTIFKNGCWFNGSHIPMTTPMYKHNVGGYFHTDSTRHCYFPPKYKDGYIRHYYTKSFSEWLKKSRRGWPDGTESLVVNNYFVCEDWANLPIDRMRMGLFSEFRDEKNNKEYHKSIFEHGNIINVTSESQNIYGLMVGMYNLMSICRGYVFMLSEDYIDDTVFNLLLEYAIKTDNKVVWVNTLADRMEVVAKYGNNNNETYYNVDFR